MIDALTEIGPAVIHGGMSTFLAFILLAASESYVFFIFFKVCWFPLNLDSFFFKTVPFDYFHCYWYDTTNCFHYYKPKPFQSRHPDTWILFSRIQPEKTPYLDFFMKCWSYFLFFTRFHPLKVSLKLFYSWRYVTIFSKPFFLGVFPGGSVRDLPAPSLSTCCVIINWP